MIKHFTGAFVRYITSELLCFVNGVDLQDSSSQDFTESPVSKDSLRNVLVKNSDGRHALFVDLGQLL